MTLWKQELKEGGAGEDLRSICAVKGTGTPREGMSAFSSLLHFSSTDEQLVEDSSKTHACLILGWGQEC